MKSSQNLHELLLVASDSIGESSTKSEKKQEQNCSSEITMATDRVSLLIVRNRHQFTNCALEAYVAVQATQ